MRSDCTIAPRPAAAALAAALLAAGCTGNPLTLPPVTASMGADTLPVTTSDDPPVEVYARVARGALKCWFGPEGSLKKTHVFHAKADPQSAGGAAEIGIHTREEGSTHGVLRAFAITISPVSGGGSQIEAQNVRFPEDQAGPMRKDVHRWVKGEEGCTIVGTGGWNAAQGTGEAAKSPAVVPKKPVRKTAGHDKAAKKP